MHSVLNKILSFSFCVVYIFASCGFVRHTCGDKDMAYISLLTSDECSHCLEHKSTGHACCNGCEKQTQTEDEDCCEKTVETISSDQTYSYTKNISAPIFFTEITAVCSDANLICHTSVKSAETDTPLFYYKTPLIYHTGQLRL